ncbi:type II toxin-antitoxin system CcdA family antitoxin [Halococcus sp. PRR34]|uniref:type II toxin-antitoxin system CcdA family antitoxin n=1 Tax=Halococcus sp. PRR34 TaxID=3020830 RepID=UPI00235FF8F6|nr:type II toxin-antitoxin system CcdA family antitoxin [Halococcus sp. PRR34]
MTTVSIRVPDELKQQADELDLNKSEVMRSALAKEVRRRRRQRMDERRDRISEFDVDLSDDEIAAAVRKSRDEDAR